MLCLVIFRNLGKVKKIKKNKKGLWCRRRRVLRSELHSRLCFVGGRLFKNRSPASSQWKRDNEVARCHHPSSPVCLGDFCQMYLRILIKSTNLIRDYVFLSRLLSSHEICLQLFREGAHQWTSCLFFPPLSVGDYLKEIVYPLKCF